MPGQASVRLSIMGSSSTPGRSSGVGGSDEKTEEGNAYTIQARAVVLACSLAYCGTCAASGGTAQGPGALEAAEHLFQRAGREARGLHGQPSARALRRR